MRAELSEAERQLLIVLATMVWADIKDDREKDAEAQALLWILRKLCGVDKRVIVEG